MSRRAVEVSVCSATEGADGTYPAGLDRRARQDTTDLFARWGDGDHEAASLLLHRLYPDLRSVATRHLRASELSLQPSDLLHEVWVRALRQRVRRWQNRAHFFAIVGRWMRRALVDAIVARRRLKRGGPVSRVMTEVAEPVVVPRPVDHLALDQALEALATVDPVAARTVELLYFAGLSFDETAAALEVGRSTVFRRWRFARAWLYARLSG